MLAEFDLWRPQTLSEALALLADKAPQVKPLAGGTSVLVELRAGAHAPQGLVDLSKVRELRGLQKRDGDLVIGGGTTLAAGQLTLVYPDGAKIEQPVAGDGKVSFANLPRGQYQLQLTPSAFSPPTPVALSKVQDATLRIVTYQDIGLAVGVVVVVLVVLAVIGRWAIITARLRRRRRAAIPASS